MLSSTSSVEGTQGPNEGRDEGDATQACLTDSSIPIGALAPSRRKLEGGDLRMHVGFQLDMDPDAADEDVSEMQRVVRGSVRAGDLIECVLIVCGFDMTCDRFLLTLHFLATRVVITHENRAWKHTHTHTHTEVLIHQHMHTYILISHGCAGSIWTWTAAP